MIFTSEKSGLGLDHLALNVKVSLESTLYTYKSKRYVIKFYNKNLQVSVFSLFL